MSELKREVDEIFVAAMHLHHRSWEARVEPLGLYRGQPRLLRALWREEGQSLGELAEILSVQPATVTKMVQRLEKNGFVLRKTDSEDQRIIRLYLTDKGKNVRNDVEAVTKTVRAKAYRGLSSEELVILKRLLLQVRQNLASSD